MKISRVLAASAALSFAVLLGACATPSGSGVAPSPSDSASSTDDAELSAAWLDDGRSVAIVTMGSSSCVPTAGEPEYDAATATLTVELTDPEGEACTRDLVPRASLVTLPEGVDPAEDLEIVVTGTYAGDTDLDGDRDLRPTAGTPTEYAPSAGWLNDDSFVILTWGSSTCVPVIDTVETAGRDALAVKFVDPPDDQVCTMDMAPRTNIVSTEGLDMDDVEGDKVSLTLTGDGFDTTIGIIGER